ncbi:hypothetical protein F5884DRAFT_863688 [Xylogone sp. PMI_703]|nr:hypothetical protein F5884DRAFT_863688 [Xylogone sp. PMI_703]
MTTAKKKQALKNKREREYASKKINTLLKKAHELEMLPGIDVSLTICNCGRYTTYNSIDQEFFPLTKEEIMAYLILKNLLLCDFEKDPRGV